jgi:hypothetical protein
VFHSPQVLHCPAHLTVLAPHDWHTYCTRDLAISSPGSSQNEKIGFCQQKPILIQTVAIPFIPVEARLVGSS